MTDWSETTVGTCLEPLAFQKMPKILSRDYKSSGSFPIVDQGQRLVAGWTDDETGLISTHLPVVVFGDHTRVFKYVDFPFVRGADGTQVLKLKAGIDPLFFYYACKAIELPSRGYNRHFKALREQRISTPPLQEQRDIAQALRRIDDALLIQDEQLRTVQALKRAAMHTLFTRGLRGEAQKETEIGPLPESWGVVRVEEHAKTLSKGSSPKWQGFDYVKDGILFVRSQNVGNGVMEWQDKTFLPPAWNEQERRSVLQSGDVLVNLVGASIGRSAVGGPEIEGANCNQAVCFVRLIQNEVIPGFLNGFLLTPQGQAQIHGKKKDIARANLSLQDVRNVLMPKPPINEQRDTVAILDAIDRKIDLHRRKRVLLEELFTALLHKLITGEVRVEELGSGAATG